MDEAASDFMDAVPLYAGTVRRRGTGRPVGPQLTWVETTPRNRIRLLLAYPPTGTGPQARSPGDPGMTRETWTERFVRATIPHVQTLMKERERMEKEKHPEPPAEDDEEMHGDSEMEEE